MELNISENPRYLEICDKNGAIMVGNISIRLAYAGSSTNPNFIDPEGIWTRTEGEKETVFVNSPFCIKSWGKDEKLFWRLEFVNNTGKQINDLKYLECINGKWNGHPYSIVYSDVAKWYDWYQFDLRNLMVCSVDTSIISPDQTITGEDVIAVKGKSADNLIIGSITCNNYFNKIYFSGDGKISATNLLEDTYIEAGKAIQSEVNYISFPGEPVKGLLEFGKQVGELTGRGKVSDVPVGWCSWYYYHPGINEELIQEDVNNLAEYGEDIPVKYIQIDDGWEITNGDWEANEKFSSGMKALAQKISEKGFVPGLWLSPFALNANSEIYKNHPDWLIKNDKGEPYELNIKVLGYGLDTTHPEAKAWLTELFKKVTDDWGYRYLKLDFLTNATIPGKRYKENTTTAAAVREGLLTIREAVGEDIFVLACTSPFKPTVGIVDGMRIGPDIGDTWDSLKGISNRNLKRFYMHGNYFISDSDCIIVRDKESEDEYCSLHCLRTEVENETFLTVTAAAGGIIMLSDRINLLPEKSRHKLEKIMPPINRPALPMDLFERDVPGILNFGQFDSFYIYSMINWDDYECEMHVECSDLDKENSFHIFDFWHETYLGSYYIRDGFSYTVSPHEAKHLFFTKDTGQPVIVGSNVKIYGGVTQSYDTEKEMLAARIDKMPGFDPYIYMHAARCPKLVNGGEIEEQRNSIYKIRMNADNCLINF